MKTHIVPFAMNFQKQSILLTVVFHVVTSVLMFSPMSNARSSRDALDTEYDCLIEPYVITEVGSSTQGIVTQLMADRGAVVRSGQALAQLETIMEEAATDQAIARTEMRGEVVRHQADLELAQLDSERFSKLHANGLAPAQQRDEAVTREKIANAALEQAVENQKLLLLELKRMRRVLAQRTIRSPINGVIVNQFVFPGELVLDNPIMSVAQLDPLRVEVVLPARLFGTVQTGDVALIHSEITTDEPFVATVNVVDPSLDSHSGTFGVQLLLDNQDLDIPAGQKCRLTFQAGEDSKLISVTRKINDEVAVPESLGAAAPVPVDGIYSRDR